MLCINVFYAHTTTVVSYKRLTKIPKLLREKKRDIEVK